MVRLLVVALLIGLLAGCARSPGQLPAPGALPAVTVLVFADGFHSGLIVPRQALPRDLDPVGPPWADRRPGRSFHYGEEAWTSGEDMSTLHAMRLAFVPGAGVVQSDLVGLRFPQIPGTNPARFRTWAFTLSAAGWEALTQRLRHGWLADDPRARPAAEGDPTHLFTARPDWSVWWNCHDFTADLLRAAGLDLPSHTIAMAGVLERDLDLAQEALTRAGVTVLTP